MQIHSQLGNSYFLHSDPDLSGSPPRRAPPPVGVKQVINQASCSSEETDPLNVDNTETAGGDYGFSYRATTVPHSKPVEQVKIPPLGLPDLHTGTGPLLFSFFWLFLRRDELVVFFYLPFCIDRNFYNKKSSRSHQW